MEIIKNLIPQDVYKIIDEYSTTIVVSYKNKTGCFCGTQDPWLLAMLNCVNSECIKRIDDQILPDKYYHLVHNKKSFTTTCEWYFRRMWSGMYLANYKDKYYGTYNCVKKYKILLNSKMICYHTDYSDIPIIHSDIIKIVKENLVKNYIVRFVPNSKKITMYRYDEIKDNGEESYNLFVVINNYEDEVDILNGHVEKNCTRY